MKCNAFSLVGLIINPRNAVFINSKEFVMTHFVSWMQLFQENSSLCCSLDSLLTLPPLPPPLPVLISPSSLPVLHHPVLTSLSRSHFCSPLLPSFSRPFPRWPHSSVMLSDSPYDGADLCTAGLSLSHTLTHAHTHINTHTVVSQCSTHYWIVFFFSGLCFVLCFWHVLHHHVAGVRPRFHLWGLIYSTSAQNIASDNVCQCCFSSLARVWTTTHKHMCFVRFSPRLSKNCGMIPSVSIWIETLHLPLLFCKTERDKLERKMGWNFEASRL